MLGQILSRRDGASGVAELERALLVFGNCGADRRSGDVRRLLVGRGSKRFAGHGASALTPREREVAGLALRGAPSREIAARLFIGERTVESHLAHIYAKLGVRGRIELLRCLREQDL